MIRRRPRLYDRNAPDVIAVVMLRSDKLLATAAWSGEYASVVISLVIIAADPVAEVGACVCCSMREG
jgi:hypothetical protein